ncbi:MAG: BamA/TamA family outer membrane protein [Leptospiraceae bacterium]|nr:BamA/TamA family outer membrane protein [Leptospiraceae bacterium]
MKDKNKIKIFFYIFIFITFAGQVLAQDSKDAKDSKEQENQSPTGTRPPVKGLPFEIDEKKRLSETDAAKKKEGWFPTGIGGPFSDPNNGAGFGGRVFLFNNGKKGDPFFEYTPYRHRFFLNVSTTTKNAQYHQLDWDAPYIFDTKWRARANAIYDRNPNNLFFGLGEASMKGLSYHPRNDYSQPIVTNGNFPDQQDSQAFRRPPNAGEPQYLDNAAYNSALIARNPISGMGSVPVTDQKFNRYDLEVPQVNLSAENSFFGGLMRLVVGTKLSNNIVRRYDGTIQKASDPYFRDTNIKASDDILNGRLNAFDANLGNIPTVNGKTKVTEDYERGKITGINGGYVNILRLGIVYDSRDFEPDPSKGIFAELTHERSSKAMGSNFEFNRTLGSVRVFYSPFPKVFKKLVFAGRALFVHNSGNLPFFEYRNMWTTEGGLSGLGGRTTLRGYIQDRFVGTNMGFANLELRYRFLELPGFTFNIAPLFDLGRVWDTLGSVKANAADGYKYSYGLGLRIIWNQSTVIYAEWAKSRETRTTGWNAGAPFADSNFYFNFGHIF